MATTGTRSFFLEDKTVYDWHRIPLGTVVDAERDPKTNATKSLIVNLNREAQFKMGTRRELLSIPASYVCGIREDGVTLDRSLRELRRIEVLSTLSR